MSDLHFSEEHRLLREQIRRFVESEVRPVAGDWETAGHVPREVLRRMGELGFLGARVEPAYGGAGMDALATVVLAEELGQSGYGGFAITVLVHTDMASPHLSRFGTDGQKQCHLPAIVAGNCITAVAVTEPDAGSDVGAIRTRAAADNGGYVLHGSKIYITNGVHADLYFVAAKTDITVKGSGGITMFMVEKGTPGFTVGRALEKSGWLSSDTAELTFEGCRVSKDAVLGGVNRGFYSIMRNFQNERIALAAQAVGECDRALQITRAYVRDRKVFGSPLWDKQTVRQRLAMLSARVEAGRQLVHDAAWRDSQGNDCVREVSMAKAYCGELVNDVMYTCQQFHGGAGYVRGTDIERMVRDARIHAIGGGATEVMLEEIAKREH